jgi:hypothetical protein
LKGFIQNYNQLIVVSWLEDIPFILELSSVIVLADRRIGTLALKKEEIPSGIDSNARRFIDG